MVRHFVGPCPWFTDGYQLIEAPYLGMEHQSGDAEKRVVDENFYVTQRETKPGE